MAFIFTALSSDAATVRAADNAGVDRIGIDIERWGKAQRQGHIPDSRISPHRLEDLASVAANVTNAEIFIRINPIHEHSRAEIEAALAFGAESMMLPQFHTIREVDTFLRILDGRAVAILLLETPDGIRNLREILRVDGVSEVMVGLNDLHLALGMSSHFEVVSSGLIRRVSDAVLDAGLRFGFGGVARIGDYSLPVPPDLVLAQYPRLGATSAWLSRSFFRELAREDLKPEVLAIRRRLDFWGRQHHEVLEGKCRDLEQLLESRELAKA